MHTIKIRSLLKADWSYVSKIYLEGIQTEMATFETQVPSWEKWDEKYIHTCRLIAEINEEVTGFIVLSKISKRNVYNGVAEVSIYISEMFQKQKIGQTLLNSLITESEKKGFWTLQANIFPQNKASINLFLKCGFRKVGLREKIGKLNQKWYDNYLLERRSELI